MDWERLKNLGRDWRSQFKTIEFLGEIEVQPSTIEEVCHAVGEYLHLSAVNEDFRATLAVTVVNLAYDAEEDTPQSFREHVLSKFGLDADTSVWEEQVGKPVVKLLEKYFHEHPTEGPYRYVTPILRQAGVPARSVDRFSSFFLQLIQQLGWQFSQLQYSEFIEEAVLPHALKEFLSTETGWRFCLDLARVLSYRQLGLVTQQTLGNLPGFRGRILERLWQAIQTVPAHNRRIPRPRLILDVGMRRLALQFAEEWLDGSYFWADGGRIRKSQYYLDERDFRRALSVTIRQPDGSIDNCPIELWWPEKRKWADFHPNGTYQNAERLAPGRHLLALPDCVELSDEVRVYEDIGELYLPGWHGSAIRIVDCELPPGLHLPEIGLSVNDRSAAFPWLSFDQTPSPWPNAHHVFSGQLPQILVNNWSADFAQKFLITIEDGSGKKFCDELLFRSTGNFRCQITPPSQGQIRIEPPGRTPSGFERSELSFVLLPCNAHLEWPERLLQMDDDAIIMAHPPEQLRVQWSQEEIEQIATGRWRVPPNLNFVVGQVTYQNKVSFPIAGHIYRVALDGPAIKENVLWSSQLRQRADLQIKLSPAEAGRRIEFGALCRENLVNAASLGPVSRLGSIDLNTDNICDALENPPQPVSVLAVRLPSGQILSTGTVYIAEQRLLERLRGEQNPDKQEWEHNLPESLRYNLRLIQNLRTGPLNNLAFSGSYMPESLRNFFREIELCWRVFDKVEKPLGENQNPDLRALLAWFNEARRLLSAATPPSPDLAREILGRRPDEISLLHISRWREAYKHVERQLAGIRDWISEVRHWSLLCRRNQWQQAQEGIIGQLPGGKTLTVGAKDYQTALVWKSNGQLNGFQGWIVGAYQKFEQAAKESGQGKVWEIAIALRVMAYYHFGHVSFTSEADLVIDQLSVDWDRFKCTLRNLQRQNFVSASAADSLGLADISPHSDDDKLEILNDE
jgi:hypothetical protein